MQNQFRYQSIVPQAQKINPTISRANKVDPMAAQMIGAVYAFTPDCAWTFVMQN